MRGTVASCAVGLLRFCLSSSALDLNFISLLKICCHLMMMVHIWFVVYVHMMFTFWSAALRWTNNEDKNSPWQLNSSEIILFSLMQVFLCTRDVTVSPLSSVTVHNVDFCWESRTTLSGLLQNIAPFLPSHYEQRCMWREKGRCRMERTSAACLSTVHSFSLFSLSLCCCIPSGVPTCICLSLPESLSWK